MSLKISSLEAALVESKEKAAAAPTGQGCLNTFHAHYGHRIIIIPRCDHNHRIH